MGNNDNVKGLKEESKVYEKEMLSILLQVSKSFSDDNVTKEKRDQLFEKIDNLREKVKDIDKIVAEIEERKFDIAYKDINDEVNCSKECEKYELENVEVVEKIEVEDNEKNNDIETDDKDKEKEENLEELDKVLDDMESQINKKEEKYIEDDISIDIETKKDENEDIESDIEKIDKLIQDAKELNNNIIKFPEEKVTRRNTKRNTENVEKNNNIEEETNEDNILDVSDYSDEESVEPVPVLFGNRRVQNQMIIRKKSNSFTDKLKSLVFKIKRLLGSDEDEED